MATSSDRKTATRSSSRGRQTSQSARRKSNTRSSAQRKSSNGAQAKTTNGSRAKATSASRAKGNNGSQAQANHRSESDHFGREALTAAIGATVGVAGGVLLGRTALAREHKVLGVHVPKKIDLAGVGHQLGEAGRQFGKLASEVRAVRQKAEQVGKVLT